MTTSAPATDPTFEIVGTESEPTDAAVSALARLLLAVDAAQNNETKNQPDGAHQLDTTVAQNTGVSK